MLGLRLNLDVVEMQEKLRLGNINWRDPDSVYEAYKLAYGNEHVAKLADLESRKFLNDEATR